MKTILLAAAVACARLVVPAFADNTLSNVHVPTGSGTTFVALTTTKDASFEFAPGQDWLLRSVTLNMDFAAGGTGQVAIWSGAGGTPTTQLLVLNSPAQVGAGEFTFTVPSATSLVMRANTKYWIRVTRTSAANTFIWSGTSPQTRPTGVATSIDYVLNGSPSTTFNRFTVNALPIAVENIDGTTAGAGTSGATFTKDAGWVNRDDQSYLFRAFVATLDCFAGAAPLPSIWSGFTPTSLVTIWSVGNRSGQVDLQVSSALIKEQLPGETFWLRLENNGGASYRWNGTEPETVPTGAFAESRGFLFNGSSSGVFNRFVALMQPIISSSGDSGPDIAGSSLSDVRIKACSFSTPPGRQGRLQFVRLPIVRGTGIPEVSIWRGGLEPQSQLALLGDPEVIHAFTEYEEIQFRARVPVPLAADNTYWVVVRSSNANAILWPLNNSDEPIAEGLAHGGMFLFSTDGGATWGDSAVTNAFVVIGPGSNACPADLTTSSDPANPTYGVPDGVVDASDFFFYLDRFTVSDVSEADLTASSDPLSPDYGVRDGIIDGSDFFFFLDKFEIGCP